MCRVDLLPDKFEGTAPRPADERVLQALAVHGVDPARAKSMVEGSASVRKALRRTHYASCWCLQEHESEAMWRIYCGADQGVAVVLPYSSLKASLGEPGAYIGTVTYIDYAKDVFALNNGFNMVMHKRREFTYENEVRLVTCVVPLKPYAEWTEDDLRPSIALPWDPDNLAQIVVSPYAPAWYLETIRETVGKIIPALAERVVASSMTAAPYY